MVRASLRALAERAARGKVIRRRLPAAFGALPIYVSPDAALRLLHPRGVQAADPLLFKAVERLVGPGMTVWDIGANCGLFGVAAAARAGPSGQILMVEPDPWLCSLLQRTAAAQTGSAVGTLTVASVAVSRNSCLSTLHIAARGRASNALDGFGKSQTGGTRQKLVVSAVSLDDLLVETFTPDVVKIDIEGAELLALQGGSELLKARPAIFVEVAEQNSVPLTEMLRSHDYTILDAEADFRPVARCPWATVALPRGLDAIARLSVS